jgi:hypothetical protein
MPLKRRAQSLARSAVARSSLAPGNDIEDRFASAVKAALDASSAVGSPSITEPAGRPRRSRAWGIALMCAVFAVIVAIVVAAALYVRRANVARVRSAGRGSPWTRRVAVDVELGGPEAPH